jgi:undecaprenyl-diphosphatase
VRSPLSCRDYGRETAGRQVVTKPEGWTGMRALWQFPFHMIHPQPIAALPPSSPPVRQRTALWAAAIGWAGYLAVVALFLSGKADRIDQAVVSVLRHDGWLWTAGSGHMREAMRDLTALGGTLLLVLVTAGVALVLVALRRRREALALALAAMGAPIFNSVMKAVIARPRPDVATRLTEVTSASFPSGHSFNSAAIYISIALTFAALSPHPRARHTLIIGALFLSAAIATSRIWLGVHYPTDVIAGWMGGVGWAFTAAALASWVSRADRFPMAS